MSTTQAKKRHAGNQGPRPCQPMRPATLITPPETLAAAENDPAVAKVVAEVAEIWRNDKYVAIVRRYPNGDVASLSIRRDDRKPARDWRDFQRIKNEIAGPEIDSMERYPPESMLVDNSNQYWIWCLPAGQFFPFGFGERAVSSGDPRFPQSVQRPLALHWHRGTHQDWREHDGHRRHAHSRNGLLTIDPHDTQVHFEGGLPFSNPEGLR